MKVLKSTGFFHFTERTDKTNQQGIVVGCNYGSSGATAMVDTGDVHALMIGAAGVGKTAYFLYPNLEYACASGMSFITSDTKGDLFRHYGKIAKEYYGYIVLPEEDSSKHFMV
jgi:type IV secretion system protein VirD4